MKKVKPVFGGRPLAWVTGSVFAVALGANFVFVADDLRDAMVNPPKGKYHALVGSTATDVITLSEIALGSMLPYVLIARGPS